MNKNSAAGSYGVMNEANSFLEIFADVFPWHIHHTYDFVLDFLRSRNDLFMKKMKLLLTDGKHGLSPESTCSICVTPYKTVGHTKHKNCEFFRLNVLLTCDFKRKRLAAARISPK